MQRWVLQALLVWVACLAYVAALDNGLARTPHMGYNTWNCFAGDGKCCVHLPDPPLLISISKLDCHCSQ